MKKPPFIYHRSFVNHILTLILSAIPYFLGAADPPSFSSNEDPLFSLPEVLITAPTYRISPNSSLTATVLDRDRLNFYQPRTLSDALSGVAGVDTASYGASGSSQIVSLRGCSSEHILVLLDGRPLNTAQGGGVDLSLIPVENLERIEIIRGPAPSRFGVEGLGGVINLVPERHFSRPIHEGRLETAMGSNGSSRLSGLWHSPLDARSRTHLRISGSTAVSAPSFGFYDTLRQEYRLRDNSDSFLRTGSMSLTQHIENPRVPLSLALDLDQTLSRRGSPGLVEFPTPHARLDQKWGSGFFKVSWRPEEEFLIPFSLSTSMQRRLLNYRDPDAKPLSADDCHRYESRTVSAEGEHFLNDHLNIHPSGGLIFHRLISTTDGNRYHRVQYFSLESKIYLGRFSDVEAYQDLSARLVLEPCLRQETSKLFHTMLAPRAGALLTLHRGSRLALKVNTGKLVKSPSFDDLFFSAAAFARGNPNLRPEHAFSYDVSFQGAPGPFFFALTAFREEIRDLIQWSPDFGGRWRPLNVSRARITGLEGEGSWSWRPHHRFPQFTWDGSFTLLKAQDRSGIRNLDGKMLIRRPPSKSSLGLRIGFMDRFHLHYRLRFISYRYLDTSNLNYLPGYFLQQVGAGFRPWEHFEVAFTVYNLSDVLAVDLNDYPLPGRQWELKSSFGF